MQQVVYVASPESQQIHVWHMDNEGTLSLKQVVNVGAQGQPMAISPNQRFLYIGVRPQFRVVAYRIAQDGTLTEAAQAPLPGSPTHISTDHQGRWLFAGSYNDACVSISPLNEEGLPGEPMQVIGGLDGCHSANSAPDDKTVFVPALKQDRIHCFQLSDSGRLMPASPAQLSTKKGAGPRHMAFHPNRQYAYCVNELDSTVDVWRLCNSDMAPHPLQQLDMQPPGFEGQRWAADIHLTPDGRFLYACDRTSSTLTVFSVAADGGRLNIEGWQQTEMQPRGFNIDAAGRFLICAGQKSHHITVYHIATEKGLLQPLGRYAVGQGPMWVVCRPL